MEKCLILLATYNGQNYIKEQIDSILAQKRVHLNIVVSDDVSTDNTLSIIESYNDERIKILPMIGKFGSASQNFFRLIRDTEFDLYDYIAFADQDDIWYSNKIFNAIKEIESKNMDAYSSNVLAFWPNGKTLIIDKAQSQKKYDFLFSSPGPGCTYVFKKKLGIDFKAHLLSKVELTKKIDLHDWLIYAFARSKNFKWFIDKEISMKYRQHESNEFGANAGLKVFKDRWNKSRNGWYRIQILKTAEFCDINNRQIKLLKQNNYIDRLKLITGIFDYRRKVREAVFLGLTFIIPGYK